MKHELLKKVENRENKENKYLIYKERLGEGTYGRVHLAGLSNNPDELLACKIIEKLQIINQVSSIR